MRKVVLVAHNMRVQRTRRLASLGRSLHSLGSPLAPPVRRGGQMNLFRPGSLLAICAGLTAVAVPWAFSIWLRANDAFIGGVTMIGSSDGRPREIATGWLFVMTGLLAALAYAAPRGLALVLTRRLSTRTRNILVLGILPVAPCFIWYGLTRRS